MSFATASLEINLELARVGEESLEDVAAGISEPNNKLI